MAIKWPNLRTSNSTTTTNNTSLTTSTITIINNQKQNSNLKDIKKSRCCSSRDNHSSPCSRNNNKTESKTDPLIMTKIPDLPTAITVPLFREIIGRQDIKDGLPLQSCRKSNGGNLRLKNGPAASEMANVKAAKHKSKRFYSLMRKTGMGITG